MVDTFYKQVEEQGVIFYTRHTDLLRPGGRTNDVEDEVEIQAKVAEEEAKAELMRDITYDDFKAKFEDHIEGRAAVDRTMHGSDDEGDDQAKSRTKSKAPLSNKASALNQDGIGEMHDSKSNISNDDPTSKGRSEKLAKSVTSGMTKTADNFKFDLPESCFISMMKGVKIEKLDSKFNLVSHPYP